MGERRALLHGLVGGLDRPDGADLHPYFDSASRMPSTKPCEMPPSFSVPVSRAATR